MGRRRSRGGILAWLTAVFRGVACEMTLRVGSGSLVVGNLVK